MIGLIDYGCGNQAHLKMALEAAGYAVYVIKDEFQADEVSPSCLVLPGCGNFAEVSRNLASSGLDHWIRRNSENLPIIGICSGMHSLFEGSEEAPDHDGLGLLKGRVRHLTALTNVDTSSSSLTLPIMGRHSLHQVESNFRSSRLRDTVFPSLVYVAHSYAAQSIESGIQTHFLDYGIEQSIPAVVVRDNVTGLQFHPELSGQEGASLLASLVAGIDL